MGLETIPVPDAARAGRTHTNFQRFMLRVLQWVAPTEVSCVVLRTIASTSDASIACCLPDREFREV